MSYTLFSPLKEIALDSILYDLQKQQATSDAFHSIAQSIGREISYGPSVSEELIRLGLMPTNTNTTTTATTNSNHPLPKASTNSTQKLDDLSDWLYSSKVLVKYPPAIISDEKTHNKLYAQPNTHEHHAADLLCLLERTPKQIKPYIHRCIHHHYTEALQDARTRTLSSSISNRMKEHVNRHKYIRKRIFAANRNKTS